MEFPLPITRRQALAGACLLLVLLVLAGRQLTHAGTARADEQPFETVAALAPEDAPQLLVHVVGAVNAPGLYELEEGSRIADALARAGGATAEADLERVNLASPVADGTQVVVPSRGAPGTPGAAEAGAGSAGSSGPIHLNSATAEELETLPGVGPVTAEKIVSHRDKHGAFRSVEELEAISGIGPKRVEQLRDLVVP